MPTAAPLPPEACVADGLAWSGSVKSCCSGYAFGEWCTCVPVGGSVAQDSIGVECCSRQAQAGTCEAGAG